MVLRFIWSIRLIWVSTYGKKREKIHILRIFGGHVPVHLEHVPVHLEHVPVHPFRTEHVLVHVRHVPVHPALF